MKFSRKMQLMVILSHKKPGFHPPFKRYFLKNQRSVKGPGTSSQPPALSQKHFRNACHTAH